ncbi:MAG: hydantoinase/oxoprolinase family protein [Paracoccaceae bacterium]|nr:hydantoinase/oxoprolinase family protein [Paracoccaceae bacterium]
MDRFKLAIDIGGTFVDIVVFNQQTKVLRHFKVPTTPDNPAQAVLSGVSDIKTQLSQFTDFIHGTTLGLNAILERKGAKVGIITNKGFEDVFLIARGSLNFSDMYRFDFEQPPTLVQRRNIRGVNGRINFLGKEISPLDEKALLASADELINQAGCEAIAINFLHSYANTKHEKLAVKLLNRAFPETAVSAGGLLANEYREYERTSTAVLDAYIKPVLKDYLQNLKLGMRDVGFDGKFYAMNSAGGALTFQMAEAKPISTIFSGPAGGVSGALDLAKIMKKRKLLSIDVGGTSLDANLILDFQPVDVFEAHVDNFPILQPIFDLRTLGAGGGSIAKIDNKLLTVGPKSAGAVPGPACYGRGGNEATLTDAALHLGFITASNFMGGKMEVADTLAKQAIDNNIAKPLKIKTADAAISIIRVLVSKTASAIKEMMLERGLDPRDFSLLAFGGCGPLIGPMLFDELEMAELIVPPLPSVFSALGMMTSDLSFSQSMSVLKKIDMDDFEKIRDKAKHLKVQATNELLEKTREVGDPISSMTARVRFIGQEHTLSVPFLENDTDKSLFARFTELHLNRFGHSFKLEAEVVSLIVKLTLEKEKPDLTLALTSLDQNTGAEYHKMFDDENSCFIETKKLPTFHLEKNKIYEGPFLVYDEGSSMPLLKHQTLVLDKRGIITVRRVEEKNGKY